jgi:AcrR family transcriptional regulator
MARKSAEERREEIIEIAIRHFAEGGYHGTSTDAIAREAGISQPYLFRLFRTKRELFLACTERCFAQVANTFAQAVADSDDEPLYAMGCAYEEKLLPDRHALLFQMQAYATSDPEIRAAVRDGYRDLVRHVAELAGKPVEETWEFFAHGMLLNVVTALDLGPEWRPPPTR